MAVSLVGVLCSDILRAVTKRGRYFRNLAVFLLVWATQAAVNGLFFRCPCYEVTPGNDTPYRRFTYSVLWFVIPTFLFWIVGLFLLDRAWRCMIGCRNRPRPYPDQGCLCFWKTMGESLLAPASWLFLVFLDGTFLECAMAYTPANCLDTSNMTPANLEAILDRNTEARWKSTVIALSFAFTAMCGLLLVSICYRCCSSVSYYEAKYSEHIQSIEEEAFADAAKEENYPVFKARWKALFRYGTDDDWTDASALPYAAPVKKKVGFIHSQFHGMRFGAEDAFIHPELLPSYRAATDSLYGKDARRENNGTTSSKAPSAAAIRNTESPSYQEGQRKNKRERQKKRPGEHKVQITTPKDVDSDEAEA